MPDCHYGYGMRIGGILVTKNVIVPNAVGIDIGCGMCYIQTNIQYKELQIIEHNMIALLKLLVNQVMRDISVGFALHKKKQPSKVID